MPCYHPAPASWDRTAGHVTLWPPIGEANLQLPCGTCLGCRTKHASGWALRASHEASLHQHNCFLTLTYTDKELPADGQLQPQDLTNFLKRLRAHLARGHRALRTTPPARLRYLAAGEYGEQRARPHYHILLFNCGFADTYPVAKNLEESTFLSSCWPHGAHRLGQLTGASANYVAQYTLKKIGGQTPHSADGVVLRPPFLRASLKPALGTAWLDRFHTDTLHGYLVTDGRRVSIPRTYKKQLKSKYPVLAETSEYRASAHARPSDPARLRDAEIIHTNRQRLTNSRHL